MKKTLIFSFVLLALFGVSFGISHRVSATSEPVYASIDQLPATCTSAYDGCNNCSRTSGSEWMCTMRACLVAPTQPAVTCTGYTKTDDKPTMCTKEYMPVCGQPKMPECKSTVCHTMMPAQKTYSNTCMMKADGATLVSEGACGDQGQKICTMEYAPVCGKKTVVNNCKPTATTACTTIASWKKSKTYSNTCMMKADGATFVRSGECNADNDVWVEPPAFCSDNGFKKLNRGTRGDHVRALQQYLSDNGYNPGTIDGVFGRRVVEAVRAFQKDRGIKQDGIFGNGSRAKICY